jgi:glycosyltransferase involved in cell wall biosynthesis
LKSKFNVNFQLHIAGEGPERSKLEKLIQKLNLRDTVKLLGKLPYERISKEYQSCNLVVSSSVSDDPLTRVIIEAFAAARPIIATDVGGSVELVSKARGGIVVPSSDPTALADAIRGMFLDENLQKTFAENGIRFAVRHLSEEVVAQRHLEVYRLALKKQKKPQK